MTKIHYKTYHPLFLSSLTIFSFPVAFHFFTFHSFLSSLITMSGCGMNSSGNANHIGSSRGPNRVQEQCVICHRVFCSTEALINHYDVHIRGSDELMNFQNNNNVRDQNQAAAAEPQAQRRLAFALPPSFSAAAVPPVAIRATHTVIQARPIQPVGVGGPIRRRQNLAPRVNMARPAARPRAAQRNQPATAAAAAAAGGPIPDVINLEFGEEGNDNNTDGGINLDLTLGR